MSEAYERERQNNSRLDDLASKVTSLRDNEAFASFTTGLKQSAGRITRMAATGSKGQTIRLAGMIVGGVVVLYLLWGLFF
ncbi:hypothetical protein C7212DRAFT_307025 [Tuber magnatum]|uniref:Uncharacterized protein n=1 Tax=Tuber magnatum TaxID=42249 RepID=A0A317T243_9PEZI|nr:hypothetical protein C7212DRAFT_307025 [Tuber magnatum]